MMKSPLAVLATSKNIGEFLSNTAEHSDKLKQFIGTTTDCLGNLINSSHFDRKSLAFSIMRGTDHLERMLQRGSIHPSFLVLKFERSETRNRLIIVHLEVKIESYNDSFNVPIEIEISPDIESPEGAATQIYQVLLLRASAQHGLWSTLSEQYNKVQRLESQISILHTDLYELKAKVNKSTPVPVYAVSETPDPAKNSQDKKAWWKIW